MTKPRKLSTDTYSTQTGQEPDQTALPDELLTIAEVAAYLKISRRTAWRWCKSGRLPASKVGHQWRIARGDLERLVQLGSNSAL